MRRFSTLLVATLTAVVAVPAPATAATDTVDTTRLREAVTVDGVTRHARAMQRIASANGNTRASGTSGYDASAAYVKDVLTNAGYRVTEQKFTFPFYRELTPATVAQVSPTPQNYPTMTMDYSATGDVTGRIIPTNDVVIPPGAQPNSSTSGCEATDFVPAAAEAQIALIQRGTCGYAQKVENAMNAGYDAVVIFNEGQPGRDALVGGTLFEPYGIPVVLLSHADGAAIYASTQSGATVMRVATKTEVRADAVTSNIIADSPGGSADKVLAIGAHLDSVANGPGVNDNGSGVGALLEIAKQMAQLGITPRQKLRFTFWGAEEFGSLGSHHYVEKLTDVELGSIFAYLNFDMIGSPNFARFVYDGDGSEFDEPGPVGSGEIEQVFNSYFGQQHIAVAPTVFDFRSDYVPFFDAGIPTGGVFSGSDGIKTPAQAAVFGGTAGAPYDACYHKACDTITNVNNGVLSDLSDGAAHTIMTLALTQTFPFTTNRTQSSGPGSDQHAASLQG